MGFLVQIVIVFLFFLIARVFETLFLKKNQYQDNQIDLINLFFLNIGLLFIFPNAILINFALVLLYFINKAAKKKSPETVLFILFATPLVGRDLPTFGIIESFTVWKVFFTAVVMLVVPLYMKGRSKVSQLGRRVLLMVILSLVVSALLELRETTVTDAIRRTLNAVFLTAPLFVALIVAPTLENLIRIRRAMVLLAFCISFLAVFETLFGWYLFSEVLQRIGGAPIGYLFRDGLLRSKVFYDQSLVLGTILATFFVFFIPDFRQKRPPIKRFAFGTAVLAGLLSTLSRGPIVSAVAGLLAFRYSKKRELRLLILLGTFGFVFVQYVDGSISLSNLSSYIPFLGDSDVENASYRDRLRIVGWQLASENLLFGLPNYTEHPMMLPLIQGQGIVDMVNVYLAFVLERGLIGAGLHFLPFILSLMALLKAMTQVGNKPDLLMEGRALFGASVSFLILIGTLSWIGHIPAVYYLLIGLNVLFSAVVSQANRTKAILKDSEKALSR